MNSLLCLSDSLSLPGGTSFICGSLGDCLMTLLQVALLVWIVFATLGAIVDIALRRKGSAGYTGPRRS